MKQTVRPYLESHLNNSWATPENHDATEDDAIVYALDTPIPGTDAEVGHRVEIAIPEGTMTYLAGLGGHGTSFGRRRYRPNRGYGQNGYPIFKEDNSMKRVGRDTRGQATTLGANTRYAMWRRLKDRRAHV